MSRRPSKGQRRSLEYYLINFIDDICRITVQKTVLGGEKAKQMIFDLSNVSLEGCPGVFPVEI